MISHFSKRLASDIPLLTADALAFHLQPAKDVSAAEYPAAKALRNQLRPKVEMLGEGVACVPIAGALAYNPELSEMVYDGVEDSRAVLKMIQDCAKDPNVKGILLSLDTPGGMFLGGPEIADAVRAAGKPVVAHIGGMGASLGYLIASQAKEVIANPSAIVGSIGVIASVVDWTCYLEKLGVKFEYFTNEAAKFKAAGAMGTTLTKDQRANIQANVESCFLYFATTVRGTRPQVKAEAMQGQTFRGVQAKTVGLIDRVGDERFAIGILRGYINAKGVPSSMGSNAVASATVGITSELSNTKPQTFTEKILEARGVKTLAELSALDAALANKQPVTK